MSALGGIAQFRALINTRPPVATGVLPVPKDACTLFYMQGEDAGCVNFSSPIAGALDRLSAACQVATFGLGSRDVLDETYRKAGEMSKERFACKLDEEVPKILDIVRSVLFTGGKEKANIRAELYKLNVYGEGAFFKPHQDTPRSKSMFGSLVIAYPTAHTGGALRFVKGDKTWSIDSGAVLAGKKSSVAYAVFFSDTEHEVLPVTSGYRVTVTYNLYLAPDIGEEEQETAPFSETGYTVEMKSDEAELLTLLQGILDDSAFLPEGGFMGFGLQYQYPVSNRQHGPITDVFNHLKGVDAAAYNACLRLGLKTTGKALTHQPEDTDYFAKASQWLLDSVPEMREYYGDDRRIDEDLEGGILVKSAYERRRNPDETIGERLVWITEPTELARTGAQRYGAYGNNASVGHIYADLVIFAHVGKPGSRQTPLTARTELERDNDGRRYRLIVE